MIILVALALLAANAAFVAAEFALVAARRAKLEHLAEAGSATAGKALAGIRELSLMLAAAQLGITMASLGLGAVAEPAVARWIERLLAGTALPPGSRHAVAVAIALAIVVFLHMVVGEMAPKSWAISHPERTALALILPFRAFALLFRPAIWSLNAIANGVIRLVGVQPQPELAMAHSAGDLMLLLRESSERGMLAEDQHELLQRSIHLGRLDAQAMMAPRRDIVAVPHGTGIDELERLASSTGRSRLPVYVEDLDRVNGVLHVKDLLAVPDDERASVTAGRLARPVLFTPESRLLEDLMLDMRQQRQHVAIVVDEYGSVSGLVTLEDLIEELIGEFEDETDRRRRGLRRRPDGAWLVPATLRPDEFADRTDVALPEGDWETVAGYVLATLGHIPDVGEALEFEGGRLEVTKIEGNRVLEVAVHPPPPPPDAPELPRLDI